MTPRKPPPPPQIQQHEFRSTDEIDRGIRKLERRIEEIQALDPRRIVVDDTGDDHIICSNIRDTIGDVFGLNSPEFQEHQYITVFAGPAWMGMEDHDRIEAKEKGKVQVRNILQGLIDRLNEKREDAGSGKADAELASIPDLETIFSLLHPTVRVVSRERFANGHYADAVEAVMKALNIEVRKIAKARGAPEMDGAQLMHSAFSPGKPVIVLGNLSTQSGRDTQQGFMEMFAGAMSAIRNPKTHDNVVISPERAIHLLFVASTLWFTLDARL